MSASANNPVRRPALLDTRPRRAPYIRSPLQSAFSHMTLFLSLPRLTTLVASIIVALCSGTNYVRYHSHAVLAR